MCAYNLYILDSITTVVLGSFLVPMQIITLSF